MHMYKIDDARDDTNTTVSMILFAAVSSFFSCSKDPICVYTHDYVYS